MPNHVRNIVRMEGIARLPLFTEEGGRKRFDFNKIIPMPESLNIESGSITDEAIIYYVTNKCTLPLQAIGESEKELVKKKINNRLYGSSWTNELFMRALERTYNASESKKEELYRKGQTYVSNIRNYGHATWYEWCYANWGTKWNAYENEQADEDTISFWTAWSNPEPIMLKLSEMYPDVIIEHWWADEDVGSNDGYRAYKGGEIIDGDYCESCSSEAYEIYIKCWGESNCLYQDEDGAWRHHDCDTCHGCD